MAINPDLPAAENGLSGIREELRELRESLDQNDAEIDDLQIAAQRAHRPWYRDITGIISISAFLFSLLTTTFSYVIARQQEIHDNKVELRSIIQRITELNSGYNDLVSGQDAQYSGYRSDAILNELILLANQAAELMERIPPRFISMIEYKSVGDAFVNSLYPERAQEMYLKAIDAGGNQREKAIALRGYANFLMRNGQPVEARKVYERALSASQDAASVYPAAIQIDTLYTHWNWAYWELAQRECASARDHLDEAAAIASQILSATDPVALQLDSLSKSVEACQNP